MTIDKHFGFAHALIVITKNYRRALQISTMPTANFCRRSTAIST